MSVGLVVSQLGKSGFTYQPRELRVWCVWETLDTFLAFAIADHYSRY